MMGDGTKEQNLGERGDPSKRIKEHEVDAAFNQGAPKKKPDFEFDDEVNTEPTANAMRAPSLTY
jgi:hypothetical protein